MAWVRRVRTASVATAVQIAEYVDGRRRIVTHVGSALTEAELGLLLERARGLLGDAAQDELDLGIEPTPRKARLVTPATDAALFAEPTQSVEQPRVAAPQVVATPHGCCSTCSLRSSPPWGSGRSGTRRFVT